MSKETQSSRSLAATGYETPAVNAALSLADHWTKARAWMTEDEALENLHAHREIKKAYPESVYDGVGAGAARILAAEVRRLRDAMSRIEKSSRDELDNIKAGERDAFFAERIWSFAQSHNDKMSERAQGKETK